jgi:hypothetical protein
MTIRQGRAVPFLLVAFRFNNFKEKQAYERGMSVFLRSFSGLTQTDDVLDWILCTVVSWDSGMGVK